MAHVHARLFLTLLILVSPIAFTGSMDSAAGDDGRQPMPQPKARLGMNLSGPADWNTELPFVDVFRLSRRWVSQKEGAGWGKGPELNLDEHGWVTRLQPGCWAETPLCTIDGGHYPAGHYTVLYEGQGEIEFWGAASVVSGEPGRMTIEVDPDRGGFFLRLKRTDPDDYVRNIRVIMPGFEDAYRDNPFHPKFLKRWEGIACFRFMDWMHTNGSAIEHWSDRPTPEIATFSDRGVALELMIDLCNRQQADAWFCMPHLADDDFVWRFARMVRDQLDPGRKVYIEYSNEVWNGQFPQTRYSWEKAKELGLGPAERPWEGGGMFYAKRSVEIFKIWADVFRGTQRLVRVIAWQAGNTYWMNNIVLPHSSAFEYADAIAIAPYVSMNVPAEGKEPTAEEVAGWSLDRVFDHMENVSLPRAIRAMEATEEVAERHNLALVAYEGGQHMVGVGGGQDNETLTRLLHEANRDARMGGIYRRYYDAWQAAGGDLFCHFSSIGRWSKWGSWGLMEYYDDNPRDYPKFQATMQWAEKQGQAVNAPQSRSSGSR